VIVVTTVRTLAQVSVFLGTLVAPKTEGSIRTRTRLDVGAARTGVRAGVADKLTISLPKNPKSDIPVQRFLAKKQYLADYPLTPTSSTIDSYAGGVGLRECSRHWVETPSIETRAEIVKGCYSERSFASGESLKTTETLRLAMGKIPCLSSPEVY